MDLLSLCPGSAKLIPPAREPGSCSDQDLLLFLKSTFGFFFHFRGRI